MHVYIYICNDMSIVHIYSYARYACDIQYFYPFLPSAPKGDVQTNSHIGVHSSKWEYWFKPMGKNLPNHLTYSYSIPFIHHNSPSAGQSNAGVYKTHEPRSSRVLDLIQTRSIRGHLYAFNPQSLSNYSIACRERQIQYINVDIDMHH